jgi:hypothetical protein
LSPNVSCVSKTKIIHIRLKNVSGTGLFRKSLKNGRCRRQMQNSTVIWELLGAVVDFWYKSLKKEIWDNKLDDAMILLLSYYITESRACLLDFDFQYISITESGSLVTLLIPIKGSFCFARFAGFKSKTLVWRNFEVKVSIGHEITILLNNVIPVHNCLLTVIVKGPSCTSSFLDVRTVLWRLLGAERSY